MTRVARIKSLLAVLGVAAALAGGVTDRAVAANGDTSAVAVNTTDGSSVFKLAFSLVKVVGDTADQTNTAIAYSSCDACQTVAISIQILLVRADLTTFAPMNQAIAINQDCTSCDTLASAYQFAVGVGDKLKFTGEGHRRLEDIRHQLRDLRDSGLSGAEIQARVGGLMTELGDVLRTDVRGLDQPGADDAPAPPPPDTTGTDASPTETQTTPSGTETTPPPTDTTPTDTTQTDTTPTQTTPTETTPGDTTPAPPPSG